MDSLIPASSLEKFTTFGDLLRYLRRRAGITQLELSITVGYSDAQISRLEQNLRMPDIPTIEARFVPALYLEDDPRAVARLLELAASVRREDAPGLGLCPYKGLSYFDEADADLFVGREQLIAHLMDRLLALSASPASGEISALRTSGPRFLAIVGASGSGKSSLVRAGLVPALRWNKVSVDWDIHILTPAAHPLESLAMSITQENGSVAAAARLIDDLVTDPRSLYLYAGRHIKSVNNTRLLLVVDQFEELFTQCRSEEERNAFIENLLTAASEPDSPTIVGITLRADFYAHCAGYPRLRQALAQHQEYIGTMSLDELRRAIEEPARRGRWEWEPGLVDLLLHDVGQEPGALPLLSHALLETWLRRRGRTMTLSGYNSSGGVRGAIAETAEAVFADQFTPEQRSIARRIFLRLTELGDETATGDTRRRATFTELILVPEEASTTQNVLKLLADARLIITSQDSVEVAHEALIREWPTLRGWLEDDRADLRLHRRLTEAAQDWDARNREPDLLYRGARLAQALEWGDSHQDDMNPLEHEFLEAAQDLAEREATEREAQRQRELEAAQKLAEAERKRAEEQAHASRQLRKRAIYLAGAFIIALSMAFIALYFGSEARRAAEIAQHERRISLSRELSSAAINNLQVDPERSILLALEAISTTYTLEAEDALHQSILASRLRLSFPAHEPGVPVSVAFSPDGKSIATASVDEAVKIWDSATGNFLFSVSGHHASFSPDGSRLATAISGGTVKMWDATTGREIPIAGHIDALQTVSFSPDGSHVATIPSETRLRIWDIASGKELVSFPGHADYVVSASFSPDGKRALTASYDGTARVWDALTGRQLLSLSDHPGRVLAAVFSPLGSHIATASENEATLWDATTGEKLLTLTGHINTINALAYSPDGKQLAAGSGDRKVKVWDTSTGEELFTLAGHAGAIVGLDYSPDGTRLASSSEDGTVRIWDVTPAREWLTFAGPAGARDQIAFSPDGSLLAGVGENLFRLWDLASGNELFSMFRDNSSTSALAFSPDGKHIAVAGNDAFVTVYSISSGEQLYAWSGHSARINSLAFSPDGSHLATASDDFKVKLWDLTPVAVARSTTPSPTMTIYLADGATSMAFSPGGSTLAVGLNNGTTQLIDLDSQQVIFSMHGHRNSAMSLAFSPDNERIVTASLDGTARVWSTITGEEQFSLIGHTAGVMAVVYSLDGRRIATASRDGTVKLWDAVTGQELLTFFGDGSGLNSLAFSPDGKFLATSGDGGVHIRLMQISELVRLAKARLTRPLTHAECLKYLRRLSSACSPPSSIPSATPLPPTVEGRICQITSKDRFDDNYLKIILEGVEATAASFGWEISPLESASSPDYHQKIQAFVDAGCNLIVSLSSLDKEILTTAISNPAQEFMLFEVPFEAIPDNLWIQTYATDQASFLAGYVAAANTKTGKVGIFGGLDIPQVTVFMDGFALGVAYYNQKNGTQVKVIGWDVGKHSGMFSGGFCCTTEGRQMAQRLLDAGADIILPVAGDSVGWGVGAAVQEHGNAWLIGVDTDWALTFPEFADILLTSIEKRFDISVQKAARATKDGNFSGGIHIGTLATGEVSISPFHNIDPLVSPTVKADLEQIKTDIIAGKIKTHPPEP